MSGLWVCGEAAASGLHGAKRLGSNSLIEGVVFGMRTAEDISELLAGRELSGAPVDSSVDDGTSASGETVLGRRRSSPAGQADEATLMERVRDLLWRQAGLVRSAAGLSEALRELEEIRRAAGLRTAETVGGKTASSPGGDPKEDASRGSAAGSLENRILVAELLVTAGLAREESRGVHFRVDSPEPRSELERRLFFQLDPTSGRPRRVANGWPARAEGSAPAREADGEEVA